MSKVPVSQPEPKPTARDFLLRTLGLVLIVVTLALPACFAFYNQIRT